jgi:hypothetical protein
VSLPTADDLFRPTVVPDPVDTTTPDGTAGAEPTPAPAEAAPAVEEAPAKATGSGRVKHDEKMTVYITSDELLDIEHARLSLRRSHGLGVDRGRLVRAAVAIALADFEVNGDESVLVQRLSEQAAG